MAECCSCKAASGNPCKCSVKRYHFWNAKRANTKRFLPTSIAGWLRHVLATTPAGLSDVNRTLEIACSSRDQNAEVMARTGLTIIHVLAGEYADGIASAHEALVVAEKSGDIFFRYALNAFIAWGTFGLGRARESLPYWEAARRSASRPSADGFFSANGLPRWRPNP